MSEAEKIKNNKKTEKIRQKEGCPLFLSKRQLFPKKVRKKGNFQKKKIFTVAKESPNEFRLDAGEVFRDFLGLEIFDKKKLGKEYDFFCQNGTFIRENKKNF